MGLGLETWKRDLLPRSFCRACPTLLLESGSLGNRALTDCPSVCLYPCKLGEGGSLATWGWEGASSGAPAGSGSLAMGSSALSLLLLASWSWCRRATSAFRFSKSFWLSGRMRVKGGVRAGLGPPPPYSITGFAQLKQGARLGSLLCSMRDIRVTSAPLLPTKQKGPQVLKK